MNEQLIQTLSNLELQSPLEGCILLKLLIDEDGNELAITLVNSENRKNFLDVQLGDAKTTPDVTVSASLADFADVFTGKAVITQLFAAQKLRVEGDLALAMQLSTAFLFENPDEREVSEGEEDVEVAPSRFPSVRRISEQIASQQPELTEIEKRDNLSVEEFRSHYLVTGTPVIITGVTDSWELCQLGWPELAKKFENIQGITRSGNYIEKAFAQDRSFAVTAISDFINRIVSDDIESSELPPYLGNNIWPESLTDMWSFPPYFELDQYDQEAPKMWLGPAGTVTPMHRDSVDNLFVQVLGRKQFYLAAPNQWEELYSWSTDPSKVNSLEGCDVDPENPDYDKYPLSKNAKLIKVDLQPGEMLFIPEGWFHHVRSLDPQLSINFWAQSWRVLPEQ